MVQRVDGPFRYFQDIHHGVNGDTIRADSYDPGLKASTIAALSSELEGDAQEVPQQLSGDITSVVQLNPLVAARTARSLAANGHYAVALMGSFAGMVDLFDITVNSLNQQYDSDLALGVLAAHVKDILEPPKKGTTTAPADPGPTIKARLQPQYATALAQLDDHADAIARKFREGPTVANVRALVRAGLIPLHDAVLYPGLSLNDADRAAYFHSLAYLPSAPDPDQLPPIPGEDAPPPTHHWWQSALDGLENAGAWTYNHTIVPTVNGLADLGQAAIENPGDVLSILAGSGLIALGAGGEVGGGLLDVTGVGAIVGVPVNVASAAVIASGGVLAAAGGGDLIHHATENHDTLLNEADGAGRRPGDALPDSDRPATAGSNWEGRVANNGRGDVWQDPANVDAPKGAPKDANEFRDCEPTERYPDGYVRFYNEHGQPIGLDGKTGSRAHTHIPKNPDGSYPVPEGWNP